MKTAAPVGTTRPTRRKGAEQQAALYEALIATTSDLITIHDADGMTRFESPATAEVLGYPAGYLVGRNPLESIHPRDAREARAAFRSLVAGDPGGFTAQYRVRRANGAWTRLEVTGQNLLEDPRVRGVVLKSRDVSQARGAADYVRYLATHDALTGLPNRSLMLDRIAQATARAHRDHLHVAVLAIDIDRFRTVNETLGHAAGDTLLRQVSERLRQATRDIDTVARVAGDLFVVLLPAVEAPGLAGKVAERILADLRRPFGASDSELHVSVSIGMSLYPQDATGAEDLLKYADAALHAAKTDGSGDYRYFRPRIDRELRERMALEGGLRRAAERGELVLHYQPKVDLATHRVRGAEALVRWRHPELGLVQPSRFIPLAEETGLIMSLGEWVLRAACTQLRGWRDAGLELNVSVNVSARQFQQANLVERIVEVLDETGVDPGWLEIELTESSVIEDAERAIASLRKLKEHGVRVAIDDFGTGYSSLSYLKRLPLDVLKIDQSFVQGVTGDHDSAAIVKAIIGLARSLGIEVIAEGVELQGDVDFLSAWGCNQAQGFYFGRPVPSDDFRRLFGASL